MDVPFNDLRLVHRSLRTEIDEAIGRVVDSSVFVFGPEVERFEREFASYIGVKHAIGTSNGTTALILALKALGVEPGDEVIVPAMTFFASAEAVALLGARPVFVDIDPITQNIDPKLIHARITPRTKVILPVHLYGLPAHLNEIRKIASGSGLSILGDCAHAAGAQTNGKKVGSIEDIAAFSFYPSKNLGSLGEAGMVTTNDDTLAELCRRYRNHGSLGRDDHERIGLNARLEEIQAAVLSVKLPHLDDWNSQRQAVARSYNSLLSRLPLDLPAATADDGHVYHIYQIRLDHRDAVAKAMTGRGIGVNIHYPAAMHRHMGFSYLGYRDGEFPVAENLARRTLSLPCFPGITEEQLRCVSEALTQSIKNPGRD